MKELKPWVHSKVSTCRERHVFFHQGLGSLRVLDINTHLGSQFKSREKKMRMERWKERERYGGVSVSSRAWLGVLDVVIS